MRQPLGARARCCYRALGKLARPSSKPAFLRRSASRAIFTRVSQKKPPKIARQPFVGALEYCLLPNNIPHGARKGGNGVEKDFGGWISLLFHKLRKRVNAEVQTLGLTGIQSHALHYILVKSEEGPVYQRDVEGVFGVQPLHGDGHVAADGARRPDPPRQRGRRRAAEVPHSHAEGHRDGRAGAGNACGGWTSA